MCCIGEKLNKNKYIKCVLYKVDLHIVHFLPAAKPRRSMDAVWPSSGLIRSMGVFRGQGGMVT